MDLINPIIITSAICAISLAFIIIILKIYDYVTKEHNKAISKFLKGTEVILLALALIVASFTLYSSIDYSYKSQKLFNENILETKNISETNKEIVDWFKNPEPILINITNLFLNNTAYIRKYDISTSLKELVEKSSEIQIKLRNVGRNNAHNLMMYLDFNIFSYGQTIGKPPEPEHPYPFKIYSISTTPPTQTIQYHIDEKYTTQNDMLILCTDENGYYPSENCTNIEIGIGDIEIDQEKTIHIKLFSLNAAHGNMILRIVDESGEQLQRIIIQIEALTFN